MSELSERALAIEGRIENIETQLRALDKAAEGRALSPADQGKFDRLLTDHRHAKTDLDEIREQIRDEVTRAELAERARDPRYWDGHQSAEVMFQVDPSDRRYSERDRALALVGDERRAASRHLTADQRARVDGLLRKNTPDVNGGYLARRLLLTENAAYRSAWKRLMTQGKALLTPDETRAIHQLQEFQETEVRAMAVATGANGGYGVPVLIDPTIILTAQGSPNDLLNIARIETITTNEWKGVTSAGVSWSFDAEAAEVSDDSPTLAQPTVPTHKAQGFIPYTIEVGMDYPNFAAEMSTLLDEGYRELLAQALTTGSGTGEPTGIVTALDANTNVEVTPTTDGAFGAVDVYKLWDALPIKYRNRNPAWMSSTDVMNEVRQFATGAASGGDANFSVNITQESVPRLFGKPYYENDFMTDFTGTSGAANLLIVGDFKNYLVAQRAGMNVELVPHLFGTTNNRPIGQRGWYAWARVGADSINDLAFRILQNQ